MPLAQKELQALFDESIQTCGMPVNVQSTQAAFIAGMKTMGEFMASKVTVDKFPENKPDKPKKPKKEK